jgi:hypothetical protein
MNEKLISQGWQKRTTIDISRLQEIIKEYQSLGFEVHLEPVTKEECEKECKKCYTNNINQFRTIYVRKK